MLIRFRFENHRSFKSQQELSLVASSALKGLPRNVYDAAELKLGVLRVIAIYGANASGKSNVLRALQFFRSAIVDSHRRWNPKGGVPREPFALDPACSTKPSMYEADVLIGGVRYQYGFVVDSEAIRQEWLYAYPKRRKQTWFERDITAEVPFSFGKIFSGENRAIEALTRPNSLFLSAAAQNNHQLLSPIYQWFSTGFGVANEGNREVRVQHTARMAEKGQHNARLTRLLSSADLGIVGIRVTEEQATEKSREILQAVSKILDIPEGDLATTIPKVTFHHRVKEGPSPVAFGLDEESNGTKALFSLAGPILDALGGGTLLCVDELDASVHPNLAAEIVRLFNDPVRNRRNAQLVFNTHDTNLLSGALLRRDQVWFTEKDKEGSSHLYPLTDYRPRKNESLERGYLQGRYGAIPFLGGALVVDESSER